MYRDVAYWYVTALSFALHNIVLVFSMSYLVAAAAEAAEAEAPAVELPVRQDARSSSGRVDNTISRADGRADGRVDGRADGRADSRKRKLAPLVSKPEAAEEGEEVE
jgi:hypothetical protein